MAAFESASALLREDENRCDVVGPRDEPLIVAAEEALGLRLPPSYRAFVARFGAGDVAGEEIFGVIHGDFSASGVPDGIWMTLEGRRDWNLPSTMVVVSFDGGTDYLVLDTARGGEDGEAPVLVWRPGSSAPGDDLEQLAPDFGTWLLELCRARLTT
ncbi:SMI1/KNR4 family protein [Nitriliruptor alkaliphilus]|uniref:SMI1/KNR4 family protein n=1 Tax=Nitriliruptor alkaliphilus TaxID=427918 RepID=UPI0006962CC2|nr:SMI1/KNR4 family protein [Nitriliruptor alkaliphilus]